MLVQAQDSYVNKDQYCLNISSDTVIAKYLIKHFSLAEIETYKRLPVKVPARGIASTAFLVNAVRVGEAPIIVEARGNGVSASLFRNIQIKVSKLLLLFT